MSAENTKTAPRSVTIIHKDPEYMNNVHNTIDRYIAQEMLSTGRKLTKPEAAAELILKNAPK